RYDTTAGNVDTVKFSANLADYTVTSADALGFITFTEAAGAVPPGGNQGGVGGAFDGIDRVRNFERAQFADGAVTLDKFGNLYDGNGAVVLSVGTGVPAGADKVAALGLDHVAMLNGATIAPNVSLVVNTPNVFVDGTPEVGKALTIGTPGATNLGLTD